MHNQNKIPALFNKKVFFNSSAQLRNGWWMLIFIALVALTRPLYAPIKNLALQVGVPQLTLEYLAPVMLLLVTWVCLRLRREPLTSVGFALNAGWLRQFSAGVAITALQLVVIAALVYFTDGLSLTLNPERSVNMLVSGIYVMLGAVLMEELLFRGFLFQRLLAGAGVWCTQLLLALLFALAHWGNPGMDGITQVIASVDLALGALILGLAYIRTRSLALPIGLHLGWNYVQGTVLGFSVSGNESAGWFIPAISNGPVWLTGGEFGLEASIFSPLINLLFFIALWRWKKTTAAKPQSSESVSGVPVASPSDIW